MQSKQTEVDFPEIGKRAIIGSWTFQEDEIITFAKKYDPQLFHTDPEAARSSLFGALCASGWHTMSIWMKLQRKHAAEQAANLLKQGKQLPEFGPSPGMKDIRWLKPVFAGDTVTFFTEVSDIRESKSRPGWSLMTQKCGGYDPNGDPVLTFTSAVFIRL